MRRTLALVGTCALLGVLGVAPTASAAGGCQKPEPAFTYGADRIDLSLEVDYTGCNWWRKSTIELAGGLTQGPVFGAGIGAGSACRVFKGGGGRGIARWCEINLAVDHPPVEAATYTGYFEYPWKEGTVRIEFQYICASASAAGAAECREI